MHFQVINTPVEEEYRVRRTDFLLFFSGFDTDADVTYLFAVNEIGDTHPVCFDSIMLTTNTCPFSCFRISCVLDLVGYEEYEIGQYLSSVALISTLVARWTEVASVKLTEVCKPFTIGFMQNAPLAWPGPFRQSVDVGLSDDHFIFC